MLVFSHPVNNVNQSNKVFECRAPDIDCFKKILSVSQFQQGRVRTQALLFPGIRKLPLQETGEQRAELPLVS